MHYSILSEIEKTQRSKRPISKSPFLRALTLALTSQVLFGAQLLAVDCADRPTTLDAVPVEVLETCGGERVPSETFIRSPTDLAFGAEGVTAACGLMTLNDPANATTFGSLPFFPACDFAGNDFATFYCMDSGTPASLYAVGVEDCSMTLIGEGTNTRIPTGMSWDRSNETMYLSASDEEVSELMTVDLATGATTSIGTAVDSPIIIAIATDVSSGVGELYGYDVTSDNLLSIDKATGAATVVGPLGFDANYAQGMDFDDSDGTCYLFGFDDTLFAPVLRTCDTTTGNTTFIGVIAPPDLADWSAAGVMTSLSEVFADGFESGDYSSWSLVAGE